MKFIIAPDSFKGCLRSDEVAAVMHKAAASVFPDARFVVLPAADGGEGTADVFVKMTNAALINVRVTGPLGEKVNARYGYVAEQKLAFMDMASASGIELVPKSLRNPLHTSTYGTGELIYDALRRGAETIIIGIGGSATVDGGTGMLRALGYSLTDKNGVDIGNGGQSLERLMHIGIKTAVPELKKCRFRIACDVNNILTGPSGSAYVYGPQKGADPEMTARLDVGMTNFFKVCVNHGLTHRLEKPGDGAAGGLCFALRVFCGGTSESGAELYSEISGYENELCDADYVITGEGRTDDQTAYGKLCAVLAVKAKKKKCKNNFDLRKYMRKS